MATFRSPASDFDPEKGGVRRGSAVPGAVDPTLRLHTPTNYSAMRGQSVLICMLMLAVSIAIAGLAIAVQSWRPPVYMSNTASSPSGYYYGGALYQGSGMWITNKPALPSARSDLTAVSVGSTVFLMGGQDASATVLDETLEFDPIFERYNTSRARMPTPRYRFAAAAVGGKIYVIGGITVYDGAPTDSVDIYDVQTDTWTAGPPMSLARSDLAADALNGKIYVVGGYGPYYDMSVSGSLLEVLDTATGVWRTLATMPTPRGDLDAMFYAGKLFVMGGWRDRGTNDGDFVAAVEAYDPASNSWSTYANMLVPKGDFAAAVYRDRLFSVGGEIFSGLTHPCPWDPSTTCDINMVPTHDCVSLDPYSGAASLTERTGANTAGSAAGNNGAPGVWVPHAPNPGARYRFAAVGVPVSQALWVFGGTKDQGEVVDTVSAFYDTDHPPVYVHYKS